MRRTIVLALFAIVAAVSPGAWARPLRVMSINECGDQLVLALLPPSQITSVTWLSRDPSISIMWRAAMKVRVNRGSAEEVLRERPDLVIAGADTTPATRMLLKTLHVPLLELQATDNFDEIRAQTKMVAAAVGAQAKGEALIVQMDTSLRQLAARRGPPLRVAAWDGAGFGAESGSMYDALLTAAGARNVAAEADRLSYGPPGVETLLATAPDLLIEGEPGFERPGLRTDVLDNPIVRRFWGDRVVVAPAYYYVCGTPFSAQGALKLRDNLEAARARGPLRLPFAPMGQP